MTRPQPISEELKRIEEAISPSKLDLFIYEIAGQCVFPVFGKQGGLMAAQIAYLMRRTTFPNALSLPFVVKDGDVFGSLKSAVERFESEAWEVNLDGGYLGLPKELEQ